MDKILKNEMGLSKEMKAWLSVGMFIFLAASVIFCGLLYSNTRTTVRGQAIRNLTNICQLNEDSLNRAFQNREKLLEMISERLTKNKIYEMEDILKELEDFENAYECYRMGVLDETFTLYRTNGTKVDVSGMELTKQVWDRKPHVTSSYYPSDSDEFMVNMFSHPVFEDGELKYVLVATYYSKDLVKRMNLNSLRGRGFTFLLDSQGGIVVYPHQYENEEYNDLMHYVNDSMRLALKESRDSFFDYEGERYYARYEKLDINDWYLMTCAREIDVFAEARSITRNAFIALGAMWVFIAVSLIAAFYFVRRFQARLRRNFFYDSLLGIYNENALSVYFQKMPREALADRYLVVFDVDKFKEFNYIYGNENGDRLLKYIVRVFQEEVPDVLLFRHGSDYFITLDESGSPKEIEAKIKKTQDRFASDIASGVIQPFSTSGGVKKVGMEEPLRQLISDAIMARDVIKGNQLLHHSFYDDAFRDQRLAYMEMESNFSTALRNKEFQVYYQPKYNMETGEVIGAEALARWIKKDGTLVTPGAFIPCFEASRQILQLDEEILREVCRQMKEMQAEGLEIRPVSVNLSRVHLQQTDIMQRIEAIVKEAGVDPGNLSFEVTESALTEENIPLKMIADHLRQLGCRVDMDDYGVGASGPRALASECFDVVKLDKSFVDDIGNSQVEAVIEATVRLAKKLGLEVVAEGVEERYQVERLLELGCFRAQGFYYSRPLPEKEYRKLLKQDGNAAG